MKKKSNAFTLVELLVVIGIIALLVGILLPALTAARRQAEAVKCAAALREIGNAFQMYEMDNRYYVPPVRVSGATYNIDGFAYAASAPPYWFNFLAKYVTKTKVGYSGTSTNDAAQAQNRSIFWACPAWNGYANSLSTSVNGVAIIQTGYGMNAYPEYTASYPAFGGQIGLMASPTNPVDNQIDWPTFGTSWASPSQGKWYKIGQYTHPAERALVGDCLFWLIQSQPPLPPPQMAGQYMLLNANTFSAEQPDNAAETTIDWYRHGKYPGMKPGTTDEYDPNGGKVSYNVLFCDGHVATLIHQSDSYLATRMRYPG